ncbi:hypothetical protein BN946_scf184806.g43 [Trametes cinnabarina]|uniref:Uncharacterized protein n=1 Tax=Pycnoporus cinnabarinus TaxID=5643 RepID=A0A060S7A3_PYCCI|nr:hypothetical protein BN946_scf184806.g43 [Trametes cinnabarina]
MAHHNRIRHLLSGGYFREVEIFNENDNDARASQAPPEYSLWLHLTTGRDVDKFRWRCAGPAITDILALNHFATNLLGLFSAEPEHVREDDIGRCRRLTPAVQWDATEASRKGLAIPVLDLNAMFCTAESALLRSGDRCFSNGQWVLWDEPLPSSSMTQPGMHPPAKRQLGKVQEIIQVATSTSALLGKADFVLIQHAEVAERDSHYDMPRVVLQSKHSLVPFQDIQCTVNVQHNCAAHQCKIVNIERVGREEQEKTKRLVKAVRHTAPDDLILNTAQMRNSAKLMPLCCTVRQLDRDRIIHLAAMQEIEVARCRRTRAAATHSQLAGTPSTSPGAGPSQSLSVTTSNPSENEAQVTQAAPTTLPALRHQQPSMDPLFPSAYPHPMYHASGAPMPPAHMVSSPNLSHDYNHAGQLSTFYPSHPIHLSLRPQCSVCTEQPLIRTALLSSYNGGMSSGLPQHTADISPPHDSEFRVAHHAPGWQAHAIPQPSMSSSGVPHANTVFNRELRTGPDIHPSQFQPVRAQSDVHESEWRAVRAPTWPGQSESAVSAGMNNHAMHFGDGTPLRRDDNGWFF